MSSLDVGLEDWGSPKRQDGGGGATLRSSPSRPGGRVTTAAGEATRSALLAALPSSRSPAKKQLPSLGALANAATAEGYTPPDSPGGRLAIV